MRAVPIVQQFADAFRRVQVTQLQLEMLKIHYQAPAHATTAINMAKTLGYPHYSVSNGNYGRLGRALGKVLEWTPDSDLGVAVLSTFAKPENNWHWIMRPEVAGALELLGWVNPSTISLPEELDESTTYSEGAVRRVSVNAYERNPNARLKCVAHHGYKCTVCGIVLAEMYGEIGRNYIHVHHLHQLSEVGEKYEVDPVKHLLPVCPNCHSMIHRRNPPYSIEEMREIIQKKKTRTRRMQSTPRNGV